MRGIIAKFKLLSGLFIGFLNGFFGSGGGIVAVPVLRGLGLDEKEAHSTSISVIFPLAAASGFLYLKSEAFQIADSLPYLPGGLLGALFGAWLLPKLKAAWLRKIFGVIIIFSAGKLILR